MTAEAFTSSESQQTTDQESLDQLLSRMVNDLGATVNAALVVIGDRLGLYRALAEEGPLDSLGLAEKTGTTERYVREWLAAQAASGYVEYDSATETFSMTPAQIAVFADPSSPALMTGGFYSAASVIADEEKAAEAFRKGGGVEWGDHDHRLYSGVEKFFRPSYNAYLVSEWLPALDGVVEKLERGAKVADVGCGYGASTIIMARAFPNSRFFGFDLHPESIAYARAEAEREGLDNVTFEVSSAKTFPGSGYDLVAFFDCLHDMGDPIGAIAHAKRTLVEDGTVMLVEPAAGDRLEDNLNPVGRLYYAYSTTICVPSSLSQEVALGLGTQAGEERLREVLRGGGLNRFRRAAETPFNFIIEAKA